MRETRDKCWWGAGCVNYASPVLRGCGNSMEMVQADRIPTAETLGHNEIGCLLKLKNPIYSPEGGTKRSTEAADLGGFGMENLIPPLGCRRRYPASTRCKTLTT